MKSNTIRSTRNSLLTRAAAILIALSLNAAGYAASITWGPATNITTSPVETDVLNAGIVVGAFNLGDADVAGTTVNGITFAPFAITGTSNTIGNFTISEGGSLDSTSTAFGSSATPFSSLTAPYQALLQSGSAVFGGDITLTMTGLAIGQAYDFQWWSNDSGPEFYPYSTTATKGNTVALDDNTTGYVAGGLGGRGNFFGSDRRAVAPGFRPVGFPPPGKAVPR